MAIEQAVDRDAATMMPLLSIPGLKTSRVVPFAVLLLGTAASIGLAYIVAPVLIPGALLLAVLFLLVPLRRNPLIARLMTMAVLLVILWFFVAVSEMLLFFLIGMLLVYVINPTVTRLEGRGVPRWLSSLVFVILLVGGVTAAVVFGARSLMARSEGIDRGLQTILHRITAAIESGDALSGVSSFGASPSEAGKAITRSVGPQISGLVLGIFAAVMDFITAFERLARHIVNLVILPFFIFFLLKDLPRLVAWVIDAVPAEWRERAVAALRRLDEILGRYFRGAIIVAAIQGTISGTGLWIIGIGHPVLLGIMTGFMDFLPYVGLAISLVVSALVAYAGGGAFLTKILLITALYVSQKLLEATVLGPKIIGPHVGLHPTLLILSLLLFEHFMGFLGLLIAVPVSAVMMAAAQAWSDSQPPKIIVTV